ncbi:glycosyltransferase family 4 protein [Elusimicrobium minutum]|nr:glycosyltransferase family 4 protein [Elusimicrobium minutum]
MRILIVIPTLEMGGAEKTALYQAVGLKERGHDVTVLTLYNRPGFYTLPRDVKRINLNIETKKDFLSLLKNFFILRKAIKTSGAEVVISNMSAPPVTAAWTLGIKTIFAEHTYFDTQSLSFNKKLALNKADYVVFLSESDISAFKAANFKSKPVIIYNPAVKPIDMHNKKPAFFKPANNAAAAGRFDYVKGFDILIDSWAIVVKEFPDWHLSIIGEGPQKEILARQIKSLGLEQNITLCQRLENLANVYKYADLFVLSSRREGFPLALCEAMSWGTPCAAFNCPNGPDVIIKDGIDGLIIKNFTAKGLAEGIISLLKNPEKRAEFAKNAARITQKFSIEKYIDKYEALCQK